MCLVTTLTVDSKFADVINDDKTGSSPCSKRTRDAIVADRCHPDFVFMVGHKAFVINAQSLAHNHSAGTKWLGLIVQVVHID